MSNSITPAYIGVLRAQAEWLALSHREILANYDNTQLAQIYNGIGPDRFPPRLRAFVTALRRALEPVALIHDVEYHEGGSAAAFRASNLRFAANGARMARRTFAWWEPARWLYCCRARRCAQLCMVFGKPGWNHP